MEWEFSPQQVVKAEVEYGFEDFRRDLLHEVRMNSAFGSAADLKSTFDLVFDLCYWLATERRFEDLAVQYRHSPPIVGFLEEICPAMTANVAMLGAVLQRMIMSEVENDVALEEAVARVHRFVADQCLALPADAVGA